MLANIKVALMMMTMMMMMMMTRMRMTITMLVYVKKMGREMDNRAFKPPVLTAQRIWQEAKAQYCSIEYKYKHMRTQVQILLDGDLRQSTVHGGHKKYLVLCQWCISCRINRWPCVSDSFS